MYQALQLPFWSSQIINIQPTRTSSPVKQEASNCWMSGFRLCATASRSSILWYNNPSAPRTCISHYEAEALPTEQITAASTQVCNIFNLAIAKNPMKATMYCCDCSGVYTYDCLAVIRFIPQILP